MTRRTTTMAASADTSGLPVRCRRLQAWAAAALEAVVGAHPRLLPALPQMDLRRRTPAHEAARGQLTVPATAGDGAAATVVDADFDRESVVRRLCRLIIQRLLYDGTTPSLAQRARLKTCCRKLKVRAANWQSATLCHTQVYMTVCARSARLDRAVQQAPLAAGCQPCHDD